jgi:hypothetical protein
MQASARIADLYLLSLAKLGAEIGEAQDARCQAAQNCRRAASAVIGRNIISLSFQRDVLVADIYVKVGDQYKKGDKLLTLKEPGRQSHGPVFRALGTETLDR